jgi:hypothetical protein
MSEKYILLQLQLVRDSTKELSKTLPGIIPRIASSITLDGFPDHILTQLRPGLVQTPS